MVGESINPRNYKDASAYRLGIQYTATNAAWHCALVTTLMSLHFNLDILHQKLHVTIKRLHIWFSYAFSPRFAIDGSSVCKIQANHRDPMISMQILEDFSNTFQWNVQIERWFLESVLLIVSKKIKMKTILNI
jgi:hypothetical protein